MTTNQRIAQVFATHSKAQSVFTTTDGTVFLDGKQAATYATRKKLAAPATVTRADNQAALAADTAKTADTKTATVAAPAKRVRAASKVTTKPAAKK